MSRGDCTCKCGGVWCKGNEGASRKTYETLEFKMVSLVAMSVKSASVLIERRASIFHDLQINVSRQSEASVDPNC